MMSTTENELDIEVSNEREEGELEDSDVEDGTYIPLARPETFNPPSLVNMQIQDENSDEGSAQESTCTDSDDEPRRPKRTKIRPRRSQANNQPNKKEKYNVWCKALQEELLTEDMVTCDVSKRNRYGVESYDYTIKYRLNDDYNVTKKVFNNKDELDDRTTNKRRHADRSNIKLRLGKRVNSHHQEWRQKPRYLPDLIVNASDPVESIAQDIAEKLSEEKGTLVGRIVEVLGVDKALELYKETQRIEANGGMLVMNGTRRRTPGGIYFFLIKHDNHIKPEMIAKIFVEDRKETQRKIKKSRNKTRQKVMEQLKQSLTDSELPSLSRGESTVQSEHGSNPPPSPATDARDCSSDTDNHSHTDGHTDGQTDVHTDGRTDTQTQQQERTLNNYDDDEYLEITCNDDMDLF